MAHPDSSAGGRSAGGSTHRLTMTTASMQPIENNKLGIKKDSVSVTRCINGCCEHHRRPGNSPATKVSKWTTSAPIHSRSANDLLQRPPATVQQVFDHNKFVCVCTWSSQQRSSDSIAYGESRSNECVQEYPLATTKRYWVSLAHSSTKPHGRQRT